MLARLCPELADGHAWPRTAAHLSGALHRVAPGLRVLGVTVEFRREGVAGTRTLRVRRPATGGE